MEKNCIRLIVALTCLAATLTVAAQTADHYAEAWTLGTAISIGTDYDSGYDGDWIIKDGSQTYEINGGYEKFLWRGLFIRPEAAVWYRHYNSSGLSINTSLSDPGQNVRPDLKEKEEGNPHIAYQVGANIDALIAWRQPLGDVFSVDLLTGPLVGISFRGVAEHYGLKYTDFFHPVTFTWRTGVAVNISRHVRVGAYFDANVGHFKNVDTGQEHLYWHFEGEPYRNTWNINVAYRF